MKDRNITVDNIKGILIYLVVFGHMIAWMGVSTPTMKLIHYYIYSIHMPMFVLISGFVSKQGVAFSRFVSDYLFPYMVFDLIYKVISLREGIFTLSSIGYFIPSFVYWYILCIGILRVIVRYSKHMGVMVLFATLFTLISPIIPNDAWRILSIGRVFLLMPVFVVGNKYDISAWRIKKSFAILLGGVAALGEWLILKYTSITVEWATHDQPMTFIELPFKFLFMLVFTIIWFVVLNSLLDRRLPLVNKWGRNSIVTYLLHPYLLVVINFFTEIINCKTNWINLWLPVLTFVILLMLSCDVFKRSYNTIILGFRIIVKRYVKGNEYSD